MIILSGCLKTFPVRPAVNPKKLEIRATQSMAGNQEQCDMILLV